MNRKAPKRIPNSLSEFLRQPTQEIGAYAKWGNDCGEQCVMCGKDSQTCEHFEEENRGE